MPQSCMVHVYGSAEQPAKDPTNNKDEKPAETSSQPRSMAAACKASGAMHLSSNSLLETRSDESSAAQPASYTQAIRRHAHSELENSEAQPEYSPDLTVLIDYLPHREQAHGTSAFVCRNWLLTHRDHAYRFAALIVHAPTAVSRIVRYLGAHNLKTIWTCSECSPYWYNWYCYKCQGLAKTVIAERWTPRKHFGRCGGRGHFGPWARYLHKNDACLCCSSMALWPSWDLWRLYPKRIFLLCECCENLLNLKGVCHTTRDLLKRYNGR